jgi:hypothetical protein
MTDDDLDGCEIDFADPATVSTDEQVTAILCFGDLPWVGEADGVPTCDPDAVEQRIRALRSLDA